MTRPLFLEAWEPCALQTTSERVRARLRQAGASFFANDSIADHLEPGEIDALQTEVEAHVAALLDALVIDRENDHNSQDTARRVAKMFLREVYRGRYEPRPPVTDFPNVKKVDELYIVGPISVRSACSHHMVPILGSAWIGVIPGERVIGLSKFNRITEWIMARPQIQEEAVMQLADELEGLIKPLALGIVVKARHLCCGWRGVRDETEMASSVMRGAFRTDPAARSEFLRLIGSGVSCV